MGGICTGHAQKPLDPCDICGRGHLGDRLKFGRVGAEAVVCGHMPNEGHLSQSESHLLWVDCHTLCSTPLEKGMQVIVVVSHSVLQQIPESDRYEVVSHYLNPLN